AELSDEQRQRLAATIYSSSRRIQALLQDLLDASRGECKTPEVCLLIDIVTGAQEQLRQSAALHSVRIDVAIPPDLEVLAARDRLERVFVNLMQNAIDAMPGGGSIQIEGRTEAGQAIVRVEDTGPGISEEAWQNLFRPFASFGKKNGLGLGLALSRQVLLDHGGDLWVERRTAAGACFFVRLPAAPASARLSHVRDSSLPIKV
ncbi:MAG: sensor histidine kinase, partial [Terriglobia bacterium]